LNNLIGANRNKLNKHQHNQICINRNEIK